VVNECVIVLMCDVSKLITEERHTHSNIEATGGTSTVLVLAILNTLD
jgi:hypothetical protein